MNDLRPLHALVDSLPCTWSKERRARWIEAVTRAVDYAVPTLPIAPSPEQEKQQQ